MLKRSLILTLLLSIPSLGAADLEWITGGVPKSTDSKATTGTATAPDAPGTEAPGSLGNQDIVVGHLTTCTRIQNQYPVDSVNYFFQNKHPQVCYFAYFLAKPSSRIHTAMVECYSSTGLRVSHFEREYKVSFIDNLLTVKNETYQWFLLDLTIGLDHTRPEFGQVIVPKEPGLYTIHLTVDGQLVGITFFYIKPSDPSQSAPPNIPTAVPPGKSAPFPMSTPMSTAPLRVPAK